LVNIPAVVLKKPGYFLYVERPVGKKDRSCLVPARPVLPIIYLLMHKSRFPAPPHCPFVLFLVIAKLESEDIVPVIEPDREASSPEKNTLRRASPATCRASKIAFSIACNLT